jgi:hypothetical protein
VGFRGVRTDHGETSDDSKLTGLDDFGPSDQVFDWMAGRLTEDPTGRVAWGGRLFRLGVDTALELCNNSLTFIYVDVSMRIHRVKIRREATHQSNNCYRRLNYYD